MFIVVLKVVFYELKRKGAGSESPKEQQREISSKVVLL